MTTWITICDTCKRDDWAQSGQTQTDGETLATLIEHSANGAESIKIRRQSCLMGCANGCNIAIQAVGKINYTLGNFTADPDAAQAILGYAQLHADSTSGQVPYRSWPQGVKGHFVTRHPPLPSDE